jgi:hypothetical protein
MMSTEELCIWLEKFKSFPEDPVLSTRCRKSSVEEGEGGFQRTDVVLSAQFALAKGEC